MTSPTRSPNSTRTPTRELLGQEQQYAVAKIIEIDGLKPEFNAFQLIIRGHTALTVSNADSYNSPFDTETLEVESIAFNPAAVEDIGIELVRASHVVIPLPGIRVLEAVTDLQYDDTRWIKNPLNHSPAFRQQCVTYPSQPVSLNSIGDDDSDTDGAIPTPRP